MEQNIPISIHHGAQHSISIHHGVQHSISIHHGVQHSISTHHGVQHSISIHHGAQHSVSIHHGVRPSAGTPSSGLDTKKVVEQNTDVVVVEEAPGGRMVHEEGEDG